MTVHPGLPRATALLATAAVTAAVLAGCGTDGEANDPGDGSSSAAVSPTPDESDPGSESPAPATSEAAPATVAVPVYVAGDTPQGARLFREFHQVPSDNPLEEAAALLTGGETTDPDYRTLFPGGGFASVVQDGDRIVASVDGAGFDAGARLTPRQAKLAAQSLVYTLQGVTQTRNRVYVVDGGGQPVPLFGIDTTDGLSAAKQLNVLALVNVTTPEQGATVSGSFTATGVASSFEANVPWRILAADGSVAAKGFATAEGWLDKLYPWTTEVDVSALAPGDYTFVTMTDDPSGGEGSGPTEDTKAITVQ